MKNYFLFAFILFACGLLQFSPLKSSHEDLLRDLETVEYWNRRLNERMDVSFNYLLQGGYWYMPSARMGQEGEIGVGYVEASPYRLWNLRFQLTDRLEVSGNYRIFRGVKDPVLSVHGFGDFSDKGANFKVSLFHPEDSNYDLPGVAIGFEDIIGTRAFKGRYLVLTKVFLQHNLEISLGYGRQRIKGFFGGFYWMPFRKSDNPYLRGLAISAEYDATPYKDCHVEPHPKGRTQSSSFNIGFKYRLWDQFDLSLAYLRGEKWTCAISTFYNFGATTGLLTKIDSPQPYRAPINIEPIGELRPESALVPDLAYAFAGQGFTLEQAWISSDECSQRMLRLRIINNIYRLECDVRKHLNNLMAYIIPLNVEKVIVEIDADGTVIQEYQYSIELARKFGNQAMGAYELKILTPLREATKPDPSIEWLLYNQKRSALCVEFLPKNYLYFGSSTGKFKYALGAQALINGYLWDNIYYSTVLGCVAFKNIGDIKDVDRLNPSQLINVRTDIIRYYKQSGITLDEAYLQKTWNIGRGYFGRLSAGYFEVEYGGLAGEFLYYPVNSRWAVGLEGAVVGKRKVNSWFKFTSKIRKLDDFKPTYRKFVGLQYFFNLYYEWKEAKIDLRLKIGKFLANDFGIRYEVSRYFSSGLRITLWYTQTNGHDKINSQTYYDKGIAFTMPLDIFYSHCARGVCGYGMSAWLRDVGATSYTGQELYYMLSDHRK
ncbi:MAG: YjbH domain-containing protein [Parachlamydiaceae bacterium]